MAYAFRAQTSAGNASSGSLVINKPTGTVDGDLIIVNLYLESDTNTVSGVPSGFTLAGSIANTGSFKQWVYWKVAASEPSSWTFTYATSGWNAITCASFSGGVSPSVDVVGTGGQGDAVSPATSQTAPSVTTTAADSLLVFCYGNFGGADVTALTGAASNLAISFGGCTIGYASIASAGATGTSAPSSGPGTQDYAAIHVAFLLGSGGSPQTITAEGLPPRSTFGTQNAFESAAFVPTSDISAGAWTTEIGGTTNLYASVDETSANDADYIQSEAAPAASAVQIKLATMTDPAVSYGHYVTYRIQKIGSGQINMVVRLKQGATTIASWSHTNIDSAVTEYTQTLSTAEADSITDYTDLRTEFEGTQV